MNLVMERSVAFWNNENLVVCFVEALIHLTEGLNRGDIPDVFFPEVGSIFNNYYDGGYISLRSISLIESRRSRS